MNPHLHQPIKRDSSRPKLTTPITPGIHFAPNIDPSFSFNYAANSSKIFAASPQPASAQQALMAAAAAAAGPPFDFALSPYRMINFEHQMKQHQQQPPSSGPAAPPPSQSQFGQQANSMSGNEHMVTPQGKQSQQEQSYQRPVSSMWNIAGGAGNTGSLSHKFMSEYSDELNKYGNYFGSGGGPNGAQGFFNRFVPGADKQFRSGTKFVLFVGALIFTVLLISGAVFMGIFLANSMFVSISHSLINFIHFPL